MWDHACVGPDPAIAVSFQNSSVVRAAALNSVSKHTLLDLPRPVHMANNVLYAATAAVACVAQGVWSVQRGAQEGSHRQTHCGQQGQRTRIHHTQPAGKWGVCMDGWLAGFATGLHPSFSCTLASPLQDISPNLVIVLLECMHLIRSPQAQALCIWCLS